MVIGKFTGGQNLHKVLRRNLMAALSVTNSCCSVADLTILQWLEPPLNLIRILKKKLCSLLYLFRPPPAHHDSQEIKQETQTYSDSS
jgi:hypothetical protein